MKKILTSILAIAGLVLLPFWPGAQASVTGSFSAQITVPNVSATTLVFPDLSGGVNAGGEVLATSTIAVTGTTGSTTAITVGSTDLLAASSSIAFDTNASTTAADVAAAINAESGVSGYSASSNGATITITAPVGSGASLNGTTAAVSSDYLGAATAFSGGSSAGAAASATSVSTPFSAVTASTSSSTDLSLNIGSTTIMLTAGDSAAQAAASAAAAINADSGNLYTASTTGTSSTELMLTAKASGTAGNGPVVAGDLSYNGTAEVVVFTPSNVTAGETYRVTINGTHYDFTATASSTAASVTAALAPMINADGVVSCSQDGVAITCTALAAGTPFTASASVLASASTSGIAPISISSSNSLSSSCAKAGDRVTLTFTAPSALNTASSTVLIDGMQAALVSLGGHDYSASATTTASTTPGSIGFIVNAEDTGGATSTATSTTDNSMVTFYNTAPTITLNGSSTVEIANGATYHDLGATSTDVFGMPVQVTASGTVNRLIAGTYPITYTATDCAGNSASTTRMVTVDVLPASSGGSSSSSGSGSSSSSSSSGGGITTGGVVVATATLLPPITIGPTTFPGVPNTGVETEANASAIATVKTELASLISQLIGKLEAQVSALSQ